MLNDGLLACQEKSLYGRPTGHQAMKTGFIAQPAILLDLLNAVDELYGLISVFFSHSRSGKRQNNYHFFG